LQESTLSNPMGETGSPSVRKMPRLVLFTCRERD
jgi:hypothetical protein